MKKLLLFMVLFSLCEIGFAQENEYKKNQLSFGFLVRETVDHLEDKTYSESSPKFYYAGNLYYNRYLSKNHVLRAMLYRPLSTTDEINFPVKVYCEKFFFKAGYEYDFNFKWIAPYALMDIEYSRATTSTKETGYDDINKKINFISMMTGLGLKIEPVKNIVLGAEYSLALLSFHSKSDDHYDRVGLSGVFYLGYKF